LQTSVKQRFVLVPEILVFIIKQWIDRSRTAGLFLIFYEAVYLTNFRLQKTLAGFQAGSVTAPVVKKKSNMRFFAYCFFAIRRGLNDIN